MVMVDGEDVMRLVGEALLIVVVLFFLVLVFSLVSGVGFGFWPQTLVVDVLHQLRVVVAMVILFVVAVVTAATAAIIRARREEDGSRGDGKRGRDSSSDQNSFAEGPRSERSSL
jgi:uncharacterized membrane protein YgcG